ncbi:hypothetical protein Ciccas_009951 [Cichlidogyrus casuarinus]|uniref:Uncharacterized protein n=1 Tax=Cichlidogyrus casuarinus TaxID=1844966 RepID=A0ABD2PW19_9PLAT
MATQLESEEICRFLSEFPNKLNWFELDQILSGDFEQYPPSVLNHVLSFVVGAKGYSLLMLACQFDRILTVAKLIQLGCDVNYRTEDNLTALHVASRHAGKELAGELPLHLAIINGNLPACRELLKLSVKAQLSASIPVGAYLTLYLSILALWRLGATLGLSAQEPRYHQVTSQ